MKLKIDDNNQKCQADPYILEDNNTFYIYTTGVDGVKCYKSNELLGEYIYIGNVFNRKGYKEYWAPAVLKLNDKYYLYVSYMGDDEDDVHTQSLIVAYADKPEGPFQYLNDLTNPFSIDAHPVLNDAGLFMFYSINDYDAEKAGTRIVVDKMISPTQMEGKPRVVVYPSIKEEIFMKDRFKKGQDWYTIEGACYFYEDGYHYLLYSANCYQNQYYFVGYSVCESKEMDLTKLNYKKYPNDISYVPLLSKNEFESGTGHNSVIKFGGQWYIIYHGRDIEEENVSYDNRSMRIAKLMVDRKKLMIVRK